MPSTTLNVLITAGPTIERIDPARYLSNYSSGKQGYAIAAAFASAGAEVTLVSGPTALPLPQNVKTIQIESAQQMFHQTISMLPTDVAICTAAVCDWKPQMIEPQKIKKHRDVNELNLKLEKNPDILDSLAKHPTLRPNLVIGFAAETEKLIDNAKHKLKSKNCDWILANDISDNKVFNKDQTHVHLITSQLTKNLGKHTKTDIANILVLEVFAHLGLKTSNTNLL